MKNKVVGYIIIAFALVIGFIIYLFNRALTEIVNTNCSHGSECPMWGSINFHTNISIGVMILVLLVGAYMVLFADKVSRSHRKEAMLDEIKDKDVNSANIREKYDSFKDSLKEEEKQIMELLIDSDGTMFQSDIVDKTEYSKVKVTRLLDKLEGRNLIERRRRGMTNIVILKY